MSESLLRDQNQISKQTPMPTDDMSASSSIQTVSGETVALSFNSSGTRTTDAGEAAGTAVQGNLANKNIMGVGGGAIATSNDTSLSFTGDMFTNERVFPVNVYERFMHDTWVNKLSNITSGYSNGDYSINYRTGEIWGVKATTTSSMTSTSYDINQAQVGTSGGLNTDVNIDQIQGTEVNLDDAAFAVGVDGVLATGLLADETGTDSVDEGDIGLNRMTLDRRVIGASDFLEDEVFASGGYLSMAGVEIDDPTGLAAMTEGDNGNLKGDLAGRLIATLGTSLDVTNDAVSTQPVEPSNGNTSALATSLVIKASAGTLYEVRGHSTLGSTQFIQVHDASSLPADTAVPEDVILADANGNFFISYPQGKSFGDGIVVTNSSTSATKTIGAADCWFSAESI